MPLIIEDGTIVAGANSYIDVDFADSYFQSRGYPAEWFSLNVSEKESAIIYSMEYFENTFSFKSCLQEITQPLNFPRLPFYGRQGRLLAGEGVIPTSIKNSIAELALLYVQGILTTVSKDTSLKREKVGDTEFEFDTRKSGTQVFSHINRILKEYILSGSSTTRVIRG